MFEQSFVEGHARTYRGWSVVTSILLQAGGVAVALLVPLLNPGLLPKVAAVISLSPPPPAPARPPDAPQAARGRSPAPRQVSGAVLLSYSRVPERAQTIIDVPETPGMEGGVPGSAGPGAPDGRSVQNGIWGMGQHAPAIAPPPAPEQAAPKPPIRIRVGTGVQEALLINRVMPEYPALAKQTRTEGTVTFTALIARSGVIQNLQLVSGNPMLAPAAAAAVRQWRYRPTLLSGEPVEVVTTIEVHFKLSR